MFEQFGAFIKPFKEKVENILKFGKISLVNGSDGQLQKIQIKTLRNIEDSLKIGQFGFNSKCPNGSRVVVAEIGNEKIVIANESVSHIIDISSGNTIIYNKDGKYIKIEDDTITSDSEKLIVNCSEATINASSKVTLNTPLTEATGDMNVTGLLSAGSYSGLNGGSMQTNQDIITTKDTIASGISLKGHTHGGVQTGGSNTSTPN